MVRDIEKYRKWEKYHKDNALLEFEKQKAKLIHEAQSVIDNAQDEQAKKSGQGMLRVAQKMTFQFEKKWLVQYGHCTKFKKDVGFLPMVCQIETQECFKHRRDAQTTENV